MFTVTVNAEPVAHFTDPALAMARLLAELRAQGFSDAQLSSGGLLVWLEAVAIDLGAGGHTLAQHPTFYGRVGITATGSAS